MCSKCNWESNLCLAEEMLNDYEYAHDTIESIYDWIEENEHVTDKQEQALQNIYGSNN